MDKVKSNYTAIANDTVKAWENGKMSYGELQAKEYCKLSDMQFWKRYNAFKKRQTTK